MASIEFRPRTTRVITYFDKQKFRFRLGRVTQKGAERFANNIDTLLHERRCNLPISREVSLWLADLDDTIFQQLVERGLVESRVRADTLATFIGAYVDGRSDVTERRRDKLHLAKRRLIEFFGNVELASVTAGSADEYSRWLLKHLAPTTAQKECQIAVQFFRHAYRKELIERNPFEGVTVGTATNDDRRVFIPDETIRKVLATCPDWQWRTMVSLARFGGLRCPSEVALLKWDDIHWDTNRFTVTSPKTKRYGKPSRVVPLFSNLRPFLDEAFEIANEGDIWVIPMLDGNTRKNLGTRFKKIIRRTVVETWPKPFQNLRASCQTDLEQTLPTYVVCQWLGNTPGIANKHYLTVTEDHFQMAAAGEGKTRDENWGQTGDKLGMQPPVEGRTSSHEKTRIVINVRETSSFSEVVGVLENTLVAEEGLEPPTLGL